MSGGGAGAGTVSTAQGVKGGSDALSSASNFLGSLIEYDTAKELRQRSYRLTAASTLAALRENYRAIQEQSGESAAQQLATLDQIQGESDAAISAIIGRRAGSGIAGRSVANEISTVQMRAAEESNIVRMNLFFQERQRQRYALSMQDAAYQQLLQAIGQPIRRPDYVGGVLGIAKGVAGAIA